MRSSSVETRLEKPMVKYSEFTFSASHCYILYTVTKDLAGIWKANHFLGIGQLHGKTQLKSATVEFIPPLSLDLALKMAGHTPSWQAATKMGNEGLRNERAMLPPNIPSYLTANSPKTNSTNYERWLPIERCLDNWWLCTFHPEFANEQLKFEAGDMHFRCYYFTRAWSGYRTCVLH
jgi:hypothetical protein